MDPTKEKEYIFNLKLAKSLGIYQILDSGTTVKIFGRNVYHAGIVVVGLYMFTLSMWNMVGIYRLANDVIAMTFYLGCMGNFIFSCYKMANILYYADDIWKCIDITSFHFTSYPRYDRKVFQNWRKRSVQVSYVYNVVAMVCVTLWIFSPLLLRNAVVKIRRMDGSYVINRMNVYNMFLMVSEDTYSAHFNKFLFLEIIISLCFLYFTMIFDNILIIMCIALSSQLDTINDGIRSLGHKHNASRHNSSMNNVLQLRNKCSSLFFDELNTIIVDHQKVIKLSRTRSLFVPFSIRLRTNMSRTYHDVHHNVIISFTNGTNKERVLKRQSLISSDIAVFINEKKLDDYYNICRSVLLIQIFIASGSHVLIWFIAALSFSEGKDGDPILSLKLLMTLPLFTFQLFMICKLFGTINDKKDGVIFALYDSNWTDMDMKVKKLILYAMIQNNSINPKLQFTNIKIVNLEMFTNTMRVCYSIFSMLVNSNKK